MRSVKEKKRWMGAFFTAISSQNWNINKEITTALHFDKFFFFKKGWKSCKLMRVFCFSDVWQSLVLLRGLRDCAHLRRVPHNDGGLQQIPPRVAHCQRRQAERSLGSAQVHKVTNNPVLTTLKLFCSNFCFHSFSALWSANTSDLWAHPITTLSTASTPTKPVNLR